MTTTEFSRYWLPVVVYCTAIFIQSSFPTTEKLPQWPYLDKILHAAAYSLLGFLFYRALASGHPSKNTNTLLILSILFTGLYGLSDEIHQSFVPGRSAEAADALADLAGGIIGACYGRLRYRSSP